MDWRDYRLWSQPYYVGFFGPLFFRLFDEPRKNARSVIHPRPPLRSSDRPFGCRQFRLFGCAGIIGTHFCWLVKIELVDLAPTGGEVDSDDKSFGVRRTFGVAGADGRRP